MVFHVLLSLAVAASPPPQPRSHAAEVLRTHCLMWAADPKNPWALAHGVKTLGPNFLASDGRKAVDVIFHDFLLRNTLPDVYRMLLERSIDVVTFTSASAVRNFVRILGAEPAADLLASTVVACIGPITADAASHANITTTIQPSSYTIPALVNAIAKYFEGRKTE